MSSWVITKTAAATSVGENRHDEEAKYLARVHRFHSHHLQTRTEVGRHRDVHRSRRVLLRGTCVGRSSEDSSVRCSFRDADVILIRLRTLRVRRQRRRERHSSRFGGGVERSGGGPAGPHLQRARNRHWQPGLRGVVKFRGRLFCLGRPREIHSRRMAPAAAADCSMQHNGSGCTPKTLNPMTICRRFVALVVGGIFAVWLGLAPPIALAQGRSPRVESVSELSIEDLMKVDVVTASRTEEKLTRATSVMSVITARAATSGPSAGPDPAVQALLSRGPASQSTCAGASRRMSASTRLMTSSGVDVPAVMPTVFAEWNHSRLRSASV
jgi:hypothetical protein